MNNIGRGMRAILIIYFILSVPLVYATEIKASVDRSTIYTNESFNLMFEANDKIDGQPDFSVLAKVANVIGQKSSQSIQLINGRMTQTKRWIVSMISDKAGTIKIPAIAFGGDNSNPVTITIQASKPSHQNAQQSDEDFFIRVEVDEANPYVQAQVIYKLFIYRAISIQVNQLSTIKSSAQILVEQLETNKQYEVYQGGRRYLVDERHFAIFPQQAGTMVIDPITMRVEVGRGSGFYIDPFRNNTKLVVKKTEPITLTVKPIPKDFPANSTWIAASDLTINQSWSVPPDEWQQGEPVTRTITTTAQGLIPSQLPEFSHTASSKLKYYPDKPELNMSSNDQGIRAIRRDKMAIVPVEATADEIPELKLAWWNTTTDSLEYATLPKQPIMIASTVSTQTANQAPSNLTAEQDPSIIKLSNYNHWQWLSLVFALLWLITIGLWYWSLSTANTAITIEPNTKALEVDVKHARQQHDSKRLKEALIAWGRLHWQLSPVNSLADIIGLAQTQEFIEHLKHLNHHLYAPDNIKWQSDGFYVAFSREAKQSNVEKKQTHDLLKPLYP